MSDLHTRIQVRAYFMAEAAGWPEGQHEAHWLAAEAVEQWCDAVATDEAQAQALAAADANKAAKRRASALKGAATRKANREAASVVIAASALKTGGRPIRRAAH